MHFARLESCLFLKNIDDKEPDLYRIVKATDTFPNHGNMFGFWVLGGEEVRRPGFGNRAREGLVYFFPKTGEGEMGMGVRLRGDDLWVLRDVEFGDLGRFVG